MIIQYEEIYIIIKIINCKEKNERLIYILYSDLVATKYLVILFAI